jgi:hypothetical protein
MLFQFGAQALVQDDLKTFLRVDGGKTPELIFHRKDFFGCQSTITGSSAHYMEQSKNRKDVRFCILFTALHQAIAMCQSPAPQMSWATGQLKGWCSVASFSEAHSSQDKSVITRSEIN